MARPTGADVTFGQPAGDVQPGPSLQPRAAAPGGRKVAAGRVTAAPGGDLLTPLRSRAACLAREPEDRLQQPGNQPVPGTAPGLRRGQAAPELARALLPAPGSGSHWGQRLHELTVRFGAHGSRFQLR